MEEEDPKEVVITYDTLFEILRNEKTKEDLQKLHNSFFKDVINYLNEKQTDIQEKKDQKGLFESDEKEKKIQQIANIKKILKDIYERREKKILSMAVNKSRFSDSIIDTSSLLEEERLFYEMTVSLLDSQRDKILKSLLECKMPNLNPELLQTETNQEQTAQPQETANTKSQENQTQEAQQPTQFQSADQVERAKLIRFLAAVPQFMGEDMREYGPYDEEDVAKLPEGIATLLIEKERAEEIKEES